jgi:hypothetical protein
VLRRTIGELSNHHGQQGVGVSACGRILMGSLKGVKRPLRFR